MRKPFYSIFYILVFIFLLYLLISSIRDKHKQKQRYVLIFCNVLVLNAAYIVFLFTNSYYVMSAMMSLVFLCVAWMLLNMLGFICEYVGRKRSVILECALFVLIVAESVLMIVNIFNEIVASYTVIMVQGDSYFKIYFKPLYYCHLAICYFIVLVLVILLIDKLIHSSSLYRIKYSSLLICVGIAIIVNALFLFTNLYVDYSILVYSVTVIFVYYFAYVFSPKQLLKQMEDLLVENLNDPILVYDSLGNLVYSNLSAKQLFKTEDIQMNYTGFSQNILSNSHLKENTKNYLQLNTSKDKTYEVEYRNIKDKMGREQVFYLLFHDITDQIERTKERKFESTHDMLTKIFNRFYFLEEAEQRRLISPNTYYTIAINFEKFRLMNELFGTAEGDKLLVKMANTLKKLGEEHNFIYARMASDKFGIFVSKEAYERGNIIQCVLNEFQKEINTLPIDIKFGISVTEDISVSVAYDRAIMTLHTLKGKSKAYSFYNDTVRSKLIRESTILKEFEPSLEQRYFEVYFQPQINIADHSIIGAEALVRWNHPQLGKISPSEFIPLFEKNSMISKLDLFVWEEACIFLKKWDIDEFKDLSVSVNVSPIDFYQLNVPNTFIELVKKYDINPMKLKIEITETAFTSEQKMLIEEIKRLQSHGFIIEMDDFGSGYSSLNILKDIPVNVIKLDMDFISSGIKDSKTISILDSIVSMAHRLHLPVIAEGVETMEQKDILSSMNCELIQGFLYAKPMPSLDFEIYMKDHPISSFIQFWTQSIESKKLFSLMKEIDRCYSSSPIPIVILEPNLDENNQCQDLIIRYGNKAFLQHESKRDKNIIGKTFKEEFISFQPKWLHFYQEVIDQRKDKTTIYTMEDHSKMHIHAYPLGTTKYIVVIITFLNE